MKLSTQTSGLIGRLGEDQALDILAAAGYDHLDYSMFMISRDPSCVWHQEGWREHAAELRKKCEDRGMSFRQGHAPFQYNLNAAGVYENKFMPDTLKSIEIAGILGIKDLVVHPVHNGIYAGREEELFEKNMEFYGSLIPAAKEAGINISVENMWQGDPIRKYPTDDTCASPEEMIRYVDTLNSIEPIFNVCFDIGHAPLVRRDIADYIRKMGPRLAALHIHDNDWIGDRHTVPGLGQIDFNAFIKALKDVDYQGDFTFEADAFLARFEYPFLPTVAKFMADIGRYWIGKFEAL